MAIPKRVRFTRRDVHGVVQGQWVCEPHELPDVQAVVRQTYAVEGGERLDAHEADTGRYLGRYSPWGGVDVLNLALFCSHVLD